MKQRKLLPLLLVSLFVCAGSIHAAGIQDCCEDTHTFMQSNGGREATCENAGFSYEKCIRCGMVKEHYLPKKDHIYMSSAGAADEKDQYEKCMICGKVRGAEDMEDSGL